MTKNKYKETPNFKLPQNLIEAYVLNRIYRDNPLFKLPEITSEFEQAYQFFDELFQDRMNEKYFSVKDMAKDKGVDYEQVLAWASQNDLFAFGLDMAKQGCFCHAYAALLRNEIDDETGIRYCAENATEGNEEADFFVEELEKIEQ